MTKPVVLILAWMPERALSRLVAEFTEFELIEAGHPAVFDREFPRAAITYGLPPMARLAEGRQLKWIQLISAGVPRDLCPVARKLELTITNLAGLYGPTIAQHALAMMLVLARNLHTVLRNQQHRKWDRDVARRMSDLQGQTLGIVGLGNIGREMARMGRSLGMQVFGCRRTGQPTPGVDRVFPVEELKPMLAEANFLAVAAPLTPATEGMLGPAEFAAMKPGAVFINVSRGAIVAEKALLNALDSGKIAAAGLDAYATEPLPPDHPLWNYPQVIISPHYGGEIINNSSLPAERFARNLRAWKVGRRMEGIVDLQLGY
jgi:phosphoglycerate dehydrogenase-like enzyme